MAEAKKLSAEKQDIFENMPVAKAVATLAIPTIISQIVTTLYNLADTFFIGQMKNPYMVASISLMYPWVHLVAAIANLFGVGSSSLISRMLGAKRHDDVKWVSSFCLYGSLIAGAAFSLLTWAAQEPIMRFLGASDESLPYAMDYSFWVVVVGTIPTLLGLILGHLLRSEGYTKKSSFGMMFGGILNMILDPIFIFWLDLGVTGAALATMLSNAASAVYFLNVFRKLHNDTTISFQSRFFTLRHMPEVFSVGFASALSSVLASVTTLIIVRLSAAYGDVAVAAYGIVKKINQFTFNLSMGLCQGINPLIGYNFAAKNYARMRAVSVFSWKVSIIFSAVCIAALMLFAPQILYMFIPEIETSTLGAALLRFSCLSVLMNAINTLISYALQAMGYGKQSSRLMSLRHVGLNVPLLFIMNHFFGVYGVNSARLVAETLLLPICLVTYRKVLRNLPQ